jgi:mycothiol synthase
VCDSGHPSDPDDPVLRVTEALTDEEQRAVLALAEDVARADGAYPLGEQVVMHLRHGRRGEQHLLVMDPASDDLLGYAHLDTSDPVEGASAELAVSPPARRRGVGSTLLEALLDADPDGRLRLWAHGTDTMAVRLAAARGLRRERHLWQMRRSLFAPLDPVVLPSGVRLRAFDAARDAEAWLALNARCFPHLPDQAGWTRADLDRRRGQPWFDSGGFLLAEDPHGAPIGFVWTKVHGHHLGTGPRPDPEHAVDQLGEIYVIAVDPAHRGRGLGRALALAGLHHLRADGMRVALLYVDAGNAPAISLYRSLGFALWDSDTLFRR